MKKIRFCLLGFLLLVVGCDRENTGWFLIQQIDSGTYVISEPQSSQGNSVFLITGEKEAILFDSGSGENKYESIFHIVDSLTDVPVTLLLSHFHFDHIGNVSGFDRIAIPDLLDLRIRISDKNLLKLTKEEVLTTDSVVLEISRILPVGEDIDVGNRKLRIIHTPGHSRESISVIDSINGYVFTGDLVYNGLLLIDDCQEFISSLNNVVAQTESNFKVFGSHGKPEVEYRHLLATKNAMALFSEGDYSEDSVDEINFFGSKKRLFRINDISFVVGYSDAFLDEY